MCFNYFVLFQVFLRLLICVKYKEKKKANRLNWKSFALKILLVMGRKTLFSRKDDWGEREKERDRETKRHVGRERDRENQREREIDRRRYSERER